MSLSVRKRAKKGPKSLVKGKATRDAVVARALEIACKEGLAAITIGRLAKELRMSKSGLFAHFRSKETLELTTVEWAREIFEQHVLLPSGSVPEGLERLWKLCDSWLEHLEERVFPGAYFFTGAFFVCAGQRGAVSRSIVQVMEEWMRALKQAVKQAQKNEEIDPEADTSWTAFEVNGLLLGAYWAHSMGKWWAWEDGRTTILRKLQSLATKEVPSKAFDSVGAFRKYLKKRSG